MRTTGLFELASDEVRRDALISDDLRYRYWLKRWWSDDRDAPWACFIMLNPSTADAAVDDPTIRKCMGFARLWNCKGIFVVNLFAYRATDPSELLKVDDPIGPENHWAIRQAATLCNGPVVAAWGANKMVARSGWVKQLSPILRRRQALHCLKTTNAGHPWHPLYVPYSQSLSVFCTQEQP